MSKVIIYTKFTCGYCRMAKKILDQHDIEFVEIDVTLDEDKRQEMIQLSGNYTVPQIFIGNESIGGYTELAHLNSTINLRELVNPEN